jgi:N-acetyl-anhydromuramyl-L-alanine amidase AmpD
MVSRAAIETELADRLTKRGIPYLFGSFNAGGLEAADVDLFADLFANFPVNYHAYLPPDKTSINSEDGFYVLRPFTVWAPALWKLKKTMRGLFAGEVGTFRPWKDMGLGASDAARICQAINTELAGVCHAHAVPYHGACAYGLGLEGNEAKWNLNDGMVELIGTGTAPVKIGGSVSEVAEQRDGYAKSEWIRSPNRDVGRNGHLPVGIVDHIAQGTRAGVLSTFGDPTTKVSSHYLVCRDGSVVQFVRESDTAWANGWDFKKGLAAYKPDLANRFLGDAWHNRVNPNLITISIEHEGMSGEPFTPAQTWATCDLHVDIFKRHGWPSGDFERLLGHNQIDSVNRPFCPGPTFPWANIKSGNNPIVDPPVTINTFGLERDILGPLWTLAEKARTEYGLAQFEKALKTVIVAEKVRLGIQ